MNCELNQSINIINIPYVAINKYLFTPNNGCIITLMSILTKPMFWKATLKET